MIINVKIKSYNTWYNSARNIGNESVYGSVEAILPAIHTIKLRQVQYWFVISVAPFNVNINK